MKNFPKKMEILENVIIIYTNENKDFFQAVQITKDGVITGRIIKDCKFVSGGYIPNQNIKSIKSELKRIDI